MLGNNFFCLLKDDVKDLSKVFDEIYLGKMSTIFNKT